MERMAALASGRRAILSWWPILMICSLRRTHASRAVGPQAREWLRQADIGLQRPAGGRADGFPVRTPHRSPLAVPGGDIGQRLLMKRQADQIGMPADLLPVQAGPELVIGVDEASLRDMV